MGREMYDAESSSMDIKEEPMDDDDDVTWFDLLLLLVMDVLPWEGPMILDIKGNSSLLGWFKCIAPAELLDDDVAVVDETGPKQSNGESKAESKGESKDESKRE